MKAQQPQWTERQKDTINTRGKNILVSAAAGSGKTAVLIERIKCLLLEDKVAADRLLVVTFTKAAASEMKDRLARALRGAVSEYPEAAPFLRRQLEIIYKANISTFHAFALDVIRNYIHLTDVDPGFRICDEAQARLLKQEAADAVFDLAFEESDERFLDYISCYGGSKGEKELKDALVSIYEKIMSLPEPFSWLDRVTDGITRMGETAGSRTLYRELNNILRSSLAEAIGCMEKALAVLEASGVTSLAVKCREDLERMAEIAELIEKAELAQVRGLLDSIPWQTFRAIKTEQEDYGAVKDLVSAYRDRAKDIIRKELKTRLFNIPLKEAIEDITGTYPQAQVLAELLQGFHQAYAEAKKERKLLDFSDIEHIAIGLLRKEDVAAAYREKFVYIFIDEYQDSNLLQEEMIRAIKRENNVFMVGDIKQSIYKFRLAEPEIFRRKYEEYKNPGDLFNKKIDLNRNFRSKEPILKAVNGLFGRLMEYDQDSCLHPGVSEFTVHQYPVELLLAQMPIREESGDEQLEELKLAEVEAQAAARIIMSSIGKPIVDMKDGKSRPLRKRDIVILMHGIKGRGEIFYKALRDAGIDAYLDDNGGYFDTLEIMSVLDLLRIIDNFRQDIPLIGTLRSPFFGFTVDELSEIRLKTPAGPFYFALREFQSDGTTGATTEKVRRFLSNIKSWKQESLTLPIDQLSWKLMTETGYYAYMGALPGGSQRQANLRLFIERAAAFRQGGDGSIHGLLRYIKALSEKEVETGQAVVLGEQDDTVRIMTIHKSKGLEFPMVLVASLARRFVFDRLEKNGVFHKDLGIGISKVNHAEGWYRHTLLQQAIMAKKRREELEECVRVLYVAMTRPMDRLVLLAAVKDWEKEALKYETGSKAGTNYLGMIFPHLDEAGIQLALMPAGGAQSQERLNPRKYEVSRNRGDGSSQGISKEWVEHRLGFVYPHKDALAMKSKYSVSELNRDFLHMSKEPGAPAFISGEKALDAAGIGNAIHLFLEKVDLSRFGDLEYLEGFLKELVEKEYLLPEEAATIHLPDILAFAQSSLGIRLRKSVVVRREHAFSMHINHQNARVMVQGIIDCWFSEADGIVLLDYKTGRDWGRLDDEYKKQIQLYAMALQDATGHPVKEAYLCHIPGRNNIPIPLGQNEQNKKTGQ